MNLIPLQISDHRRGLFFGEMGLFDDVEAVDRFNVRGNDCDVRIALDFQDPHEKIAEQSFLGRNVNFDCNGRTRLLSRLRSGESDFQRAQRCAHLKDRRNQNR